jgi:hypothetical protein
MAGKVSITAGAARRPWEGDGVKYNVFSGVLPELAAEEVCARLARHGYHGVEWRVDGEDHFREATIDRDAPRIGALCAATGSRSRGSSAMCARMRTMPACRGLG